MQSTRDRIPPHLRQFVVEQDYGAYDEIDQAVWRFILLQTYARLAKSAHAAYAEGLQQTGIGVQRIPHIEEMDACLSRFGWGAVAVDGFIPPRAFQEFQAHRVMTIAAEIRRSEHLAYTPAPDIVHESAGHAPIVPDEKYRRFLQRFGEVGARAFSSPADRRVYAAVHQLSAVKEDPKAAPESIRLADRMLLEAQNSVTWLSEAATLSRLHWWTVEYGLVGTPADYKLYGAGLLSSLGESHFCHAPRVTKLRLDTSCLEMPYDITKPQPQLYVAEDFDHLQDVLSEVEAMLSQSRGGARALEAMRRSEELGTVEFGTGLQVIGRLANVRGASGAPSYLQLTGPCALAIEGRILEGHGPEAHPEGYGTPIGRLADGTALSTLGASDLGRFAESAGHARLCLRFASGVVVEGRLLASRCDDGGRLQLLSFEDATVTHGDDRLFEPSWGTYDMAVGEEVWSAFAGAADDGYYETTEYPAILAPVREPRVEDEALVIDFYREALRLWESPDAPELVARFHFLAESLRESFPDEWLLRWNLLECLCKVGRGEDLAHTLREELLAIEKKRPDDLPIGLGLRYLDDAYRGRESDRD
jgi:phenylalanine-4-hydroxylase